MVWSPDFASRILILKKRSDSLCRAFFHALCQFLYLNMVQLLI